jgi:DNA-binding NarL/FixJ family response regulator
VCALTALIVDDHAEFRAVARLIVEAAGFEVVAEAADGEAALAAVAAANPDVVLLDVRLPGRDGIAVAELLSKRKSPPAVVLTSSTDFAEYGERIAAGRARGFIPKDRLTAHALAKLLSETPSGSRS